MELTGIMPMHIKYRGFSLVELLVVLLILGLMVGAVVQPLSTVLDQNRYDETVRRVEAVRLAMIGDPAEQARGSFRGFASDTGLLPTAVNGTFVQSLLWASNTLYFPAMDYSEAADVVCHNGSGAFRLYRCIRSNTAALITNEPGDTWENWVQYWQDMDTACSSGNWTAGEQYRRETRIAWGWNGPYIPAPAGNKLLDGWAGPLEFDHNATTEILTITCLGADRMAGNANNETFDEDRSWTIFPSQRRGRVTAWLTFAVTNATDGNLTMDTNATMALHCPDRQGPGVWRIWESLPTTGLAVNATETFYLPASGPFIFHEGATAEDISGTTPMSQDPPAGQCTLSAVLVYDDGNSTHLQQHEILFPQTVYPGGNAAGHLRWDVIFD